MSSDNPSPPLTDEQRRRAESNRLRALAKRKSFLQHNQTTNPNWRISKCPKLEDEVQQGNGEGEERERFRVRFEICGPDSFSIATEALKGEVYRDEECLKRIEGLLFDLMPTHYTQVLDGGKASVYKLKDYDVILKCLKSSKGIEVEEIPWTTYNVLEKLSHSYIAGKWMPCRPEHLSDEEVDELIAKLPRKLAERLLPFQFDGVKFGLQRGGRCLIADEMGLGKTLQAIAIASCFASKGSILVVCPAILRYSWAEELERWLPCCLPVDIHLVFGHANNPIHLTRCPKVVVISYKMLQLLRKSILELEWTVLIVDESHHVRCTKKKSENGEVKAVLDVASKAKHIILLSGTPSLSR